MHKAPGRSRKAANAPAPATLLNDPLLAAFVAALAALPARQRHASLRQLNFFGELPKETLAILVKSAQHDMTDESVAHHCGISLRTLYRYERYRAFKRQLAGCREGKRRQTCMVDDPE